MIDAPLRRLTAFADQTQPGAIEDELLLPYDTRKKSRFKAQARSGQSWAVMLPRGHILRGGTVLQSEDGARVRVLAAEELISQAHGADPWILARAAYHLGNRHVPVQLGEGWLRYQHDHVLDAMVRGLGLEVETLNQAFEPEDGAYAGGHGHHHD